MPDDVCDLGHSEICEILLQHGAEVDAVCPLTAKTPLHQAAECGHLNVCRLLVEGWETIKRGPGKWHVSPK